MKAIMQVEQARCFQCESALIWDISKDEIIFICPKHGGLLHIRHNEDAFGN